MSQRISQAWRLGLLSLLLIMVTGLARQEFIQQQEQRQLQADLVELSRVKYGLFNVDVWKELTAQIISQKIEEFELSPGNQAEVKAKVVRLLREVIGAAEESYREQNRGSLGGWIKNTGAGIFNIFGHLESEIPTIAEQVVGFLEERENREALRLFILRQLEQYADKTFAELDYTQHDAILASYAQPDREQCKIYLQEALAIQQQEQAPVRWALVVLITLAMLYLLLLPGQGPHELFLLVLVSIVLLLMGITLPMIDIDARISSMHFSLLGESVRFEDQVLYYKSKSILEVVWLMVGQGQPELVAVGLLVLTFSVLFPVSKLIASLLYVYWPTSRRRGFVRLLVFRTGKWSMADVMVVAIFMAYIGFSGIITEQLRQLEEVTKTLEVLTTNHSTLQSGFYFFTGFVLLSLLLSQRLRQSAAF